MKKVISLLLAICFIMVCVSMGVSAAETGYKDVSQSAWYADAVQFVSQNGLMGGVGSGKFAPNDNTTRGQLVTILYRLEGEPAVFGGTDFSDVHPSDYFGKAVKWASANSIVGGVGENRFEPGTPITREQMVTILHRYSQYKHYDTSKLAGLWETYSDSDKISSYASKAMSWACAYKLISGINATTLAPGAKTTRAEIAAILMRFCQTIPSDEQMRVMDFWETFVSSQGYSSYDIPSQNDDVAKDMQPQKYVISDINGDRLPELLLHGSQKGDQSFGITWIFALDNDTPVLIGHQTKYGNSNYWYGYGECSYSSKYNAIVFIPTRPSVGTGTICNFYKIGSSTAKSIFSILRDGTMGTGLWYYADESGQRVINEAEGMSYLAGRQSLDWQVMP